MKLMKYRRLAAGVGLVGAGALALLSGPASAHNWNGNPSAPGSTLDQTPPVGPDGKHVVNMTLSDNDALAGGYVFSPHASNSVSKSRPAGCDSNGAAPWAGGVCAVQHVRFNLDSPAFTGTPGARVTAVMCHGKLAAPTRGRRCQRSAQLLRLRQRAGPRPGRARQRHDDPRRQRQPARQSRHGPMRLRPGPRVRRSGDSARLALLHHQRHHRHTCRRASASVGGPSCGNGSNNATCPPNPQVIKDGWTCIVTVAEFDPVAATPGPHVGFRVIQMKPPVPLQTEAAGAGSDRRTALVQRQPLPVRGAAGERLRPDRTWRQREDHRFPVCVQDDPT